jgi:hypothetical protein
MNLGAPFGAALVWSVLMLVLLAAPAAAHAEFSFGRTISPPSKNAGSAQVGVDSDGDAAFVWDRSDGTQCGVCSRIQTRVRTAAGTLSAIQTLSDFGNASLPQVAVAPNGDAVFVWIRNDGTAGCGGLGCTRVQARARSASGARSAVQTLSAPDREASSPQVAVDSDGDAVFAWSSDDGTMGCDAGPCHRIQARARSADGALSPVQTLSASGEVLFGSPQVGVDSDGDAVFVWDRGDGTTQCGGSSCFRVEARARSAAGTLSAVQVVSPTSRRTSLAQLGVDANGNAVFVWQRPDPTTSCGIFACIRIEARARSAAGTLSATQSLSDPGRSSFDPQVGVDRSGNAVFVWRRCGLFDCAQIQARARSAAGVLSPVQGLSVPGQGAHDPRVGVDSDGDAAFVWVRLDGTTQCDGSGCRRIQTRVRSKSGALSAIQTVSAAGQPATVPQIAVDADGGFDPDSTDAVAVWQRLDGTNPPDCCSHIQTAAQIAPPPP